MRSRKIIIRRNQMPPTARATSHHERYLLTCQGMLRRRRCVLVTMDWSCPIRHLPHCGCPAAGGPGTARWTYAPLLTQRRAALQLGRGAWLLLVWPMHGGRHWHGWVAEGKGSAAPAGRTRGIASRRRWKKDEAGSCSAHSTDKISASQRSRQHV